MYHFFVEPEQIQDKEIIITGSDVNHIKNVIRLKVGDEISISNGIDGRDYRCGIAQITEDEVRCELRFIKEDGVELPVKVCLFQGLWTILVFHCLYQLCHLLYHHKLKMVA